MAVRLFSRSNITNGVRSNRFNGLNLFTAQGGNEIVEIGAYRYHIFTSSGTFSSNLSGTVEVLCVAGGGGAGSGEGRGGGGGAGAIEPATEYSSISVDSGSSIVTVGAKGTGYVASGTVASTKGGDSIFIGGSTLTALGGGKGDSGTGGSGAGGTWSSSGGAASGNNTNIGGNGFNGGAPNRQGGGGGGATGAGVNGSSGKAGDGGPGKIVTDIDANLTSTNFPVSLAGYPTKRFSAGGGGGANAGYTVGAGGTGGGGNGSNASGTPGDDATSYGSGGGAAGGEGTSTRGGNGFEGIVIVRYLK
jgi:hypothetical protein